MQTENLIPLNATQIGVMVSGGLDSAVLLYILVKENMKRQNPVDLISLTVPRKNAQDHATKVIETIERLLNTSIKNISVGDRDIDSDYQVTCGWLDALSNKKIPVVYIATTSVPKELPQLDEGFDAPWRDPKKRHRIEQPWVLSTKDEVVDYVVKNNLYELVNVSHSCTMFDTDHCGKCFNCVERKWAFEKNNTTDTTEYKYL